MTAYPLDAARYQGLFTDEARAFLDVYRRCQPADSVPTCDGWTVATLGRHLGSIYERIERIVRTGARADIDRSELAIPSQDAAIPQYLEQGAASLATTFQHADPTAEVWTFAGIAPVSFWMRRMVHETMVHAFDLEAIEPPGHRPDEVALSDGIDEFLTAQLMRKLPRINAEGLHGRLGIVTDSGDRWAVELEPTAARFVDATQRVDTELSGDAKAIVCFLWNRVDETAITVSGDRALLATYREKVHL